MRGALALAVVLTACASAAPVERVYGGSSFHGRYIEPGAYAAFLRGAIAEAGGDARAALEAYQAAAELCSESPEIWTRLGAVRCAADRRDRKADEAFARAATLDPTYGKGWEARAKCALARGDGAGSLAAAARAAALDSSADEANAILARSAAAGRDTATREQLVALTLTSQAPLVAWDALSRWAESRGDVALWVRALCAVVRLDPTRRDAVARASEQLAGAGDIAEARSLAAAAVEAGDQPLPVARHPLAARLAVDEAIARGKAASVSLRASRARLSLEEAAGRALLLGKPDVARELASEIARADPFAVGASLVLAVAEGRDVLGAARGGRGEAAVASGAALVAFGMALWHVASPPQVHNALGHIAHDRIVDGDDAVIRPAVELVARGVLPLSALPADGLVELAAMGLGPPVPARDEASLDARHAYLALAASHPTAPRARELGARLANVASSDPIAAAAASLVALASDTPIGRDAAKTLLAIDAADPLLAAIAVRLSRRGTGSP